jgi:hypothetical protein
MAHNLCKSPKVKKSKYNNQFTEYNGKSYPSKLEANYAQRLDFHRKAVKTEERVINVKEQVPFKIIGSSGNLLFTYILDFVVTYGNNEIEYVDTKGILTDICKLKIKAVQFEYNITVKLVFKNGISRYINNRNGRLKDWDNKL